ncbi:hypothetical protein HMN09_00224000 [Mycena chlorophos]|uniref:CBS domain-containing protein n=1 Tax=Mycena chlorophos TaxID=658473 RepID=A0A8H6WHJ8_MYCCL|nr:hypothetical protein HMN09_00224000 [Mycena chlorophos]
MAAVRRLSQSPTDPLANKRMSQSFTIEVAPVVVADDPDNAQSWVEEWRHTLARDLIQSPRIVEVQANDTVEEASELLLSQNVQCLAVRAAEPTPDAPYMGLFDYADVNAFLTLAATRPALLRDEDNPRIDAIFTAARSGRVPVSLVSNLSEKNPLESLPHSATILSLLEVFSRGAHRVLIRSPDSTSFLGFVSDTRLLTWFGEYAPAAIYLETPLSHLHLPSLHLFSMVVTATSSSTVLDAMRLMSEQGVSSVAVLEDESGVLLSAVSVTDIGRVVVPSQDNQILSRPLQQFVALIKAPHGSTDGVDPYPVYAVSPQSLLSYTIQKLLATNAHRLFITRDTSGSTSPLITSSRLAGNLTGIVSVVDILSIFARMAHIDVDPARMQRHRRTSSSASSGSRSSSRSGTGVGLNRTPSLR